MNNAEYWKNKWAARPMEPPNRFAVRAYKFIQTKKFKTILDLGCGAGRDARYFSRKGLSVTAIDRSSSGIRAIQSRNSRIHCIPGDMRTVKLKKNSFDVIYAHLSLHYFDNRTTRRIFQKIHRALKPKGLFFVKCKSIDDPLCGKGKKAGPDMYYLGHVRHFFSKAYMAEMLTSFKILNIRKTSSVYHHYKSAFIEAVATK
ncbi:MAG: methyltransferase domain-containing protein [Patescibacteria group bacterium]